MDLFKASRQWQTRPPEERKWNLDELIQECRDYATHSEGSRVRYGDLRVEADNGEMLLMGKQNIPAHVSHHAMGQLCGRVSAPPSYLRTLPATLAAQNLNHGLAHQREPNDQAAILIHNNGSRLLRCLTGTGYSRIWNFEIGSSLKLLEQDGWRVPPARPTGQSGERTRCATDADVLTGGGHMLSIKVGDLIAPAGVYVSDIDMFVFMCDDKHVVENKLSPEMPLARGFFCWNSEVGGKSFGVMTFLYDHICGNHIVWGATDVREFRTIHVGEQARGKAFRKMRVLLTKYASTSVSDEEAMIEKSQQYEIAGSKEDVIKTVMSFIGKHRLSALKEGMIEESYGIAEKTPRYGNPNTPWALVSGLTEISQRSDHVGARVEIEKDAGQLINIAF